MNTRCAAEGCTNPVTRKRQRGRPAIYCSPECRPSRRSRGVTVEVVNPDESVDGRPAVRVWTVRLRRGRRAVTVAAGLGWASATALSEDLQRLLAASPRSKGAPLE
jgi:hypothetical protein